MHTNLHAILILFLYTYVCDSDNHHTFIPMVATLLIVQFLAGMKYAYTHYHALWCEYITILSFHCFAKACIGFGRAFCIIFIIFWYISNKVNKDDDTLYDKSFMGLI